MGYTIFRQTHVFLQIESIYGGKSYSSSFPTEGLSGSLAGQKWAEENWLKHDKLLHRCIEVPQIIDFRITDGQSLDFYFWDIRSGTFPF